ncbi:MAG: hypothetical protein AVDCRST_MAG75-1014, partial [uncultured Propionibacteriaceae bacterium]
VPACGDPFVADDGAKGHSGPVDGVCAGRSV